jgi:hypothetical protein
MEFDAFHHWLMLRPLVILAIALPLLAAIWMVGSRQKRRESAPPKSAVARDSVAPPVNQPTASAEMHCAADAEPREWDGGPLRPNWNRQVRLGGGMR